MRYKLTLVIPKIAKDEFIWKQCIVTSYKPNKASMFLASFRRLECKICYTCCFVTTETQRQEMISPERLLTCTCDCEQAKTYCLSFSQLFTILKMLKDENVKVSHGSDSFSFIDIFIRMVTFRPRGNPIDPNVFTERMTFLNFTSY